MAAGAVYLLNDERTRLYISADRGLEGDDRERQLPADAGHAAQVLAGPGALRLADVLALDYADDALLPGMRAVLAAPMLSRSTPEGLIVVGSRQPDAYTPEDAALLSAVASQAAVALENAWLYEDAMRRAQEATALYELSQAVGATLSLGRMLNFVADSVLALLHVDKFALFLLDPRADVLEIKIARNIRRETMQSMKPRPGEGIAGWVFEFETPTAVQDVAADHRNRSCPIDGEGVTSLVSVPLAVRRPGDRRPPRHEQPPPLVHRRRDGTALHHRQPGRRGHRQRPDVRGGPPEELTRSARASAASPAPSGRPWTPRRRPR